MKGKRVLLSFHPLAWTEILQLVRMSGLKPSLNYYKDGVGVIDYGSICEKRSVLEMISRVNGRSDDEIKIKETGGLKGDYARGVLTSRVAVRVRAQAAANNKLIASGS